MNWSNWKLWVLVAGAIVALFAIYVFAAPAYVIRDLGMTPVQQERVAAAPRGLPPSGVDRIRSEWLEPDDASFRSERNLFAFVEPPPPPPPPPPAPPPDSDKDGIPDYSDNCPRKANPDQQDIDRDGIGTACETEEEIPPPPPPPPVPQPPEFPYKYLGNFGPEDRPIAAFANGDEILNVRVGQTIGGRFILRAIGIESVEIGFVGFPQSQTRRIPMGK